MLAATSLVMSTAACDKAAPEAPPLINDYVTGLQVLGDVASQEVVNQQLGEGSDDGPQSEVDETATVINGGSVQESITSTDPFTKLRIGMEPLASTDPSASASPGTASTVPTASGVPSKGYHEITLKDESTEITAVVTITQNLPGQQFVFYFATVDKAGKQGKLAKQTVEALKVGTGEVQVSISWDVDSDVDLHVEDPNGDEVYWDSTGRRFRRRAGPRLQRRLRTRPQAQREHHLEQGSGRHVHRPGRLLPVLRCREDELRRDGPGQRAAHEDLHGHADRRGRSGRPGLRRPGGHVPGGHCRTHRNRLTATR